MKIYTASKLANAEAVNVFNGLLKQAGFEVTYEWATHGYIDNSDSELKRKVAQNEMEGVAKADYLVVLHPGGFGTHIEIGVALAMNIPIIMIGFDKTQPTPSFYYLDSITMFDGITESIDFLLAYKDRQCKLTS